MSAKVSRRETGRYKENKEARRGQGEKVTRADVTVICWWSVRSASGLLSSSSRSLLSRSSRSLSRSPRLAPESLSSESYRSLSRPPSRALALPLQSHYQDITMSTLCY